MSWKVLTGRGHRVCFATPDGQPGQGDPVMLTGVGLDPWGQVRGLRLIRIVGLLLRANGPARSAYRAMALAPEFRQPLSWHEVSEEQFDGLLLPGGHWARGMRAYLESNVLQKLVSRFFAADKPVAAICHGVILAARSHTDRGQSVLHGRKTTALTWALEGSASAIARTMRWWDPNYYRTYPDLPDQPKGFMSVQQEVTRVLEHPSDFLDVPRDAQEFIRKTSGLFRDSHKDERAAWVVRDGNYISARWPGDVHRFARLYSEMLDECRSNVLKGDDKTDRVGD